MATSKNRKKEKTTRYLNDLSVANPDKFDEELGKRIEPQLQSLLEKIQEALENRSLDARSVFSIADEAVAHWLGSGFDPAKAQRCKAVSALYHACSSVVARQYETDLYRVNWRWPEVKIR